MGHHDVSGSHLTNLAVGDGSVWITDDAGDQIEVLPEDLSSETPISLATVGSGPSVISYLPNRVFAVGFNGGTVAAIDPTSKQAIWRKWTGVIPNAMASRDGWIWVVGEAVPQTQSSPS